MKQSDDTKNSEMIQKSSHFHQRGFLRGAILYAFLLMVAVYATAAPNVNNDKKLEERVLQSDSHGISQDPKEVKLVPITMKGYHFAPDKITIEAGTTVEWINTGKDVHTVTDEHSSWNSGDLRPGEKFSRRFDEKGTFKYYCVPHQEIGMDGTIIVK